MSSKRTNSQTRRLQFEQFEKKLVMSAQAVASLLPEIDVAESVLTQQVVSLEDAGTQASSLAMEYGFDGSGQTVAVIDSGIAWDHYALGNGFGEGHKVVGGWDFAENDGNPYDDGPAGFHGTHTSGIIGSSDAQFRGVAPGADLVGLRVFGDDGQGELEWVEAALQWVHDHKDDFANPITTVNLSIGTEWNAEDLPDWASLENEFAQLKADGLFISVAAGNGFRNFGEVGLSYPAVSSHVVPVASHDAEGNLSDFSQRDEGVLVAPGEMLRSTVPDHIFVGGKTGQFVGSTGTSMAAPYVAGASAILRQANESVGVENINQDMLYQQFLDSADQIYDAVTSKYYHRLNLDAALHAVVGDPVPAVQSVTEVGGLGGGESIQGHIASVGEVDVFRFTATESGKIKLSFESTDEMIPLVDVYGQEVEIDENQVTINVVAGETYDFAVSSAGGEGHYKIGVSLNEIEIINVGRAVSTELSAQVIDDLAVYDVVAVRDGLLTIETTNRDSTGEPIKVEIYDARMQLLDAATDDGHGKTRFDVSARKGEVFFVKAVGSSNSVDISFDNLVSLKDGLLTIHGTNHHDSITVQAGDGFNVNVNGIAYQFADSEVFNVTVLGHHGKDSIDVQLGDEHDTVRTNSTGLSVVNSNFRVNAFGFQTVVVAGGGGHDVVAINDTLGYEMLTGYQSDGGYAATLEGSEFKSTAIGFDLTFIGSRGGGDAADVVGTASNDVYVSRGIQNSLRVEGTNLVFNNFLNVQIDGAGGNDLANLNSTSAQDRFELSPKSAEIESAVVSVSIDAFDRINAFSNFKGDAVLMTDSANADIFDHRDGNSVMYGDDYMLFSRGFARVEAVSVGGQDIAQIFDTAGNDQILSDAGNAKIISSHQTVSANEFQVVNIVANKGGFDQAFVNGTDGADAAHVEVDRIRIDNSDGRTNRVIGVDKTELDLRGGEDRAYLTGSGGRETLVASYNSIEFESTLQMLQMVNAEHTKFDGDGGADEVFLEDLDLLESLGDEAKGYLKDRTIRVEDFAVLEAQSVDSSFADYEMEAIEYLYMLRGQWAKK